MSVSSNSTWQAQCQQRHCRGTSTTTNRVNPHLEFTELWHFRELEQSKGSRQGTNVQQREAKDETTLVLLVPTHNQRPPQHSVNSQSTSTHCTRSSTHPRTKETKARVPFSSTSRSVMASCLTFSRTSGTLGAAGRRQMGTCTQQHSRGDQHEGVSGSMREPQEASQSTLSVPDLVNAKKVDIRVLRGKQVHQRLAAATSSGSTTHAVHKEARILGRRGTAQA